MLSVDGGEDKTAPPTDPIKIELNVRRIMKPEVVQKYFFPKIHELLKLEKTGESFKIIAGRTQLKRIVKKKIRIYKTNIIIDIRRTKKGREKKEEISP